jgi:UDP-2-acetamido-2,6-beta-L-arabino-hexul-4-ose reductase
MVVGDGMVAKSFCQYSERNDVIIFASGVSNSKINIREEFEKELDLLKTTLSENPGKKLVYFSTFNLYDPKERISPYCVHKLNIEAFIKLGVPRYHIFRLGHVVGHSLNQYTILSFLYNSIKDGNPFNLWKFASRNIIDMDDISRICSYIIDNDLYLNQITDVCNIENTTVLDIVNILEEILNKKGIYTIVEEGGSPEVHSTNIQELAGNLGIYFDASYPRRVIFKYYGNS